MKAAENHAKEKAYNKPVCIVCRKDRLSDSNIYRIEGTEKTVLFDAGDVPDSFAADVDLLILNNCSPDRMQYINRIIKVNPGITVAGTGVALNFTEEFLGCRISKRIIRHREKTDIGGAVIELIPVPNVNRSRHQDRTWKKSYRFLQMPNWQWIDSVCAAVEIAGKNKTLISGQLFSSGSGSSREEYFKDKLRPFSSQVSKTLKLLRKENIDIVLPEQGESLSFQTGMHDYEQYLAAVDCRKTQDSKLIVIPYASTFGYTEQLAEAIASGASQVQDIRVKLIDLNNTDIKEAVDEIESADGVAIGTPTIEDDAAPEVMHLLAEASVSGLVNKTAAAFGSYSYVEKGVTNTLARMKQLGMLTLEEGLPIRFRPDDNDLKSANSYGVHFAKCTAAGEILPREKNEDRSGEDREPANTDRRFIIIGNGAAGTTAAEELRKLDTGCSIELISRENCRAYNRQMLTKCMLQEVPEKNMFLYGEDWYKNRNIIMTLGKEVTAIDPQNRRITLEGTETREYDKLIIAVGAEPVRIDVPGKELEGVFCIHDLSEMKNMREYISARDVRNAVILGGGIMGLETAADLIKGGMHITIVDCMSHLMPKHLDGTAAEMAAERLKNAGIDIMTSETVSNFEGEGQVEAVKLQSGICLEAQLVIQCLGIRGSRIEVNDRMETGLPDIYACGDCTVHKGVNYGLWTQAVEMARTAAGNAAGVTGGSSAGTSDSGTEDFAKYIPVIPSVTFTGFEMSFFAVGDNGSDSTCEYQSKEVSDPAEGVYKKLYFKNRKLCGGILFGDVDMTTELIEAYEKGTAFENITI